MLVIRLSFTDKKILVSVRYRTILLRAWGDSIMFSVQFSLEDGMTVEAIPIHYSLSSRLGFCILNGTDVNIVV